MDEAQLKMMESLATDLSIQAQAGTLKAFIISTDSNRPPPAAQQQMANDFFQSGAAEVTFNAGGDGGGGGGSFSFGFDETTAPQVSFDTATSGNPNFDTPSVGGFSFGGEPVAADPTAYDTASAILRAPVPAPAAADNSTTTTTAPSEPAGFSVEGLRPAYYSGDAFTVDAKQLAAFKPDVMIPGVDTAPPVPLAAAGYEGRMDNTEADVLSIAQWQTTKANIRFGVNPNSESGGGSWAEYTVFNTRTCRVCGWRDLNEHPLSMCLLDSAKKAGDDVNGKVISRYSDLEITAYHQLTAPSSSDESLVGGGGLMPELVQTVLDYLVWPKVWRVRTRQHATDAPSLFV